MACPQKKLQLPVMAQILWPFCEFKYKSIIVDVDAGLELQIDDEGEVEFNDTLFEIIVFEILDRVCPYDIIAIYL